jgi:hypothetical protein
MSVTDMSPRATPNEAVPATDEPIASIISLHQPKKPRKAKTGAERARAYRERKKGGAPLSSLPVPAVTPVVPLEAPSTPTNRKGDISKIPRTGTVTPIPPPTVTLSPMMASRSSRRSAASIILTVAALGLAAVGICMNAWYAWSLGASEVAGVLFTAVGVASDMVALVMPSVAVMAWQGKRWGAALAGWLVWILTLAFALSAGIGFASINISDTVTARASRTTPAVTAAQTTLDDAIASRDRECRGGVGRYCREREQAVVDRRQALDAAMQTVAQAADPQALAAIKLVAWISHGAISPSENDFDMLRLALLCLLPQLAGVLIMVGRGSK